MVGDAAAATGRDAVLRRSTLVVLDREPAYRGRTEGYPSAVIRDGTIPGDRTTRSAALQHWRFVETGHAHDFHL